MAHDSNEATVRVPSPREIVSSTASTHDNTVPVAGARRVLRFGSFELWPIERVLSDAGKPIPLGDRAFDLLLVMLERPGEFVAKEELIARTGPGGSSRK